MAPDTRDRLIRTTGRLLRKQGYAGTGLNQVMAEADAPKGSMYFHFPGGKQELAAAAIERFSERVVASMAETLATSSTVADAVDSFFDSHIARLDRSNFQEGCPVATVALEAALSAPQLGEATGQALRDWTDLVARALEAEGHGPTEAAGLATLVIAALEGSVVMGKGERSIEPVAVIRDTVRRVLSAPPAP